MAKKTKNEKCCGGTRKITEPITLPYSGRDEDAAVSERPCPGCADCVKQDEFCVVELAQGAYFCGDFPATQAGEIKVRLASVGTPLLARRLDPYLAALDMKLIQAQMPKARFVRIRASYTVEAEWPV